MNNVSGTKVTLGDGQLLRTLVNGHINKESAACQQIEPRTDKQHLHTLFLELLVAMDAVLTSALTEGPNGKSSVDDVAPEHKVVRYGMPCKKCHAYYPADLKECPICRSPERVSPNAGPALLTVPAIETPHGGDDKSFTTSSYA